MVVDFPVELDVGPLQCQAASQVFLEVVLVSCQIVDVVVKPYLYEVRVVEYMSNAFDCTVVEEV